MWYFYFMTTNRELVNEVLFGSKRIIDIASAILTLECDGVAPRLPYQFTVNEAVARYNDLRPQSSAAATQVKEGVDRMSGSPLEMTRLVKDARSWDEKTYELTSSPLWDIVIAYDEALEKQFPGAVDLQG